MTTDPRVDVLLESFLGEFAQGPSSLRVQSLAEGQALQLAVLDRLLANGERLAGWKVGLTSGTSRDAFGRGVRPAGFILERRVVRSGACVALAAIRECGVENELCFVLGAPLVGPDASAAAARAAVAGVAPAFEINETRVPREADPGLRIADDLSQWGLVVGDVLAPLPRDLDWDTVEVVLRRNGVEVERRQARGHIDDHFESIARLARELASFGRGLATGDRVITGSFTRQPVTAASRWEADFGALGHVAVAFA